MCTPCAYHNCNNVSRDISMFRFPVRDEDRLSIWIQNSGNTLLSSLTNEDLRHHYICAVHFLPSDIKLAKHAVPICFETADVKATASTETSTHMDIEIVRAPSSRCVSLDDDDFANVEVERLYLYILDSLKVENDLFAECAYKRVVYINTRVCSRLHFAFWRAVIDNITTSKNWMVDIPTRSLMEQGEKRSSASRSSDCHFFAPIDLQQIKRESFSTTDPEIQNINALSASLSELNYITTEYDGEEFKDVSTPHKELESDSIDNVKNEVLDQNGDDDTLTDIDNREEKEERESVANVDGQVEETKIEELEKADDKESKDAAPAGKCYETRSTLPGTKHTTTSTRPLTRVSVGQDTKTSKSKTPYSERPFGCTICQKRFNHKSNMYVHLRIHNDGKRRSKPPEQPYTCTICQKVMTGKYRIERHMKIHSKETPFHCTMCERKFKWKYSLNTHLKTHGEETPFECAICQKSFKLKGLLESHLRTHSEVKRFKCDMCKMSFKWKACLSNHLRTHFEEKPFQCDICKKGFKRKLYLNSHLITHSEEKLFVCEICERSFKRRESLDMHLKTHSEEKPFECSICPSKFKSKKNLRLHLKMHSDEKLYECVICEKRYKRKDCLDLHLRTHSDEKPFECPICLKAFKFKSNLDNHLTTHSVEKPFECVICRKRFKRKDSLVHHMRVHSKGTSCEVMIWE